MRARHHVILFLVAACLAWSATSTVLAAGKRKSGSRGKTPAAQHSNGGGGTSTDASAALAGKPAGEVKPPSPDIRATTRETVRQESRIEFDERMLRGQSASGVIYLFQRSPSEFKSIVQVPDSFRPRTVEILSPGQESR
jgi:hypothetical protein